MLDTEFCSKLGPVYIVVQLLFLEETDNFSTLR